MDISIYSVLGTDAHIQLNKKIIKKVGLTAAAMLGELVSKEKYYYETNQLTNDNMFFYKMAAFEELFQVKRKPIEAARKKLEEANFIKVQRKGIPAKLYYSINHEEIANYLIFNRVPKKDNQESKNEESNNQEVKKDRYKCTQCVETQQSAQKGQSGKPKKDNQESPKRTNIYNNRDIITDNKPPIIEKRIENFKIEAEKVFIENKEKFKNVDLKDYLNYWCEFSNGEMMFKAEKTGSFNHFNRLISWSKKESKFSKENCQKKESDKITDTKKLKEYFKNKNLDINNDKQQIEIF